MVKEYTVLFSYEAEGELNIEADSPSEAEYMVKMMIDDDDLKRNSVIIGRTIDAEAQDY